jgi:GNAT superfamily N-acetyltransferase
MTIRDAMPEDLEILLELAEQRRKQYEKYQPKFWRQAPQARELQRPYFLQLLADRANICLVSEDLGQINGFLFMTFHEAPPVYNPGCNTALVDDFVVSTHDLWASVGASLLSHARHLARSRGSSLSIVVCGAEDLPKKAMLATAGSKVSSEWHVFD